MLRWSEWGGKKQGPLVALAYLAIWQDPLAIDAAFVATGAVLAALCHAYLLNAAADRNEDAATGKLQPFATRSHRCRLIVLLAIPVITLPALGSVADRLAVLGVALVFVAGWVYSSGPRLRDRPLPGTIVAALGQRTAPLLAFAGLLDLSVVAWFGLQMAFFGSGLRGILVHQFIDRTADQHSGHRTVALRMSEHRLRTLLVTVTLFEMTGWVMAGLYTMPIAFALVLFAVGCLAGRRVWQNWTWYERAVDYAHLPLNHLYFLFLPVTCACFALVSVWMSENPTWIAFMFVVLIGELTYRWTVLRGVVAVARQPYQHTEKGLLT